VDDVAAALNRLADLHERELTRRELELERSRAWNEGYQQRGRLTSSSTDPRALVLALCLCLLYGYLLGRRAGRTDDHQAED
jgi:hypothetical protein